MKIPDNWILAETGGGCTALYRAIPDSVLEWLITRVDDPPAPCAPEAARSLSSYTRGDALLQWPCCCPAEALHIAEGAKTL